MANWHWYGQAVFADTTNRDIWYDRLRDYVDSVLDVVEHAHDTFASGLEKQTHVATFQEVQGPGLTYSLKIPDAENARLGQLISDMFNISPPIPIDGSTGNAPLAD